MSNSFCSSVFTCLNKNERKIEERIDPKAALEKYSKTGKKPSPNVSNEISKSTAEKKKKISIRNSMHERQNNNGSMCSKMNMSEIQKIEMEDDRA